MLTERRRSPRTRCLFGGFIAFNNGKATMDCMVRNLSAEGALLRFSGAALIPDRFELKVGHIGVPLAARILWRKDDSYGVALSERAKGPGRPSPLDLAARLKAYEAPGGALRARVA